MNPQHTKNVNNKILEGFKSIWITEGFEPQTVDYCENFAKEIKNGGLTTSQIRNFFGEVKRIQMKGIQNEKNAFYMLKPKLAYTAKRANKLGLDLFKDLMSKAHQAVISNDENLEKKFKNYVDLLEAILAYHKAHGGN